jgi:hypothetical protein
MINIQLLKSELASKPDVYGALSDADAAAAVVWSIPIPRSTPITFKTITAIWGLDRTSAFFAALTTLAASNSGASLILSLLQSAAGVDATNAQIQAGIALLVGAQLCTSDEAAAVLYESIGLPFGGVGVAADITEARRQIVAESLFWAWYQPAVDRWNAFSARADVYRLGGFAGDLPAGL